MFKYIDIINGKIDKSDLIHPLNDHKKNNLYDKNFFAKKFENDAKAKIIKHSVKKNLFIYEINDKFYNVFVEHTDGGGKDITYDKSQKKVVIPFHLSPFRNLIKNYEGCLVVDLYFELDEKHNIKENNYVYLIISPCEIYTSKVTDDILFKPNKVNYSASSRWVNLEQMLDVLKNKKTLLNSRRNVWIVHPSNLSDFLNSIIFDEYKNQINLSMRKLLHEKHQKNGVKYNELVKLVLRARNYIRKEMLKNEKKCQIKNCDINVKECLVVSHIVPVNEIINDDLLSKDEKIMQIKDKNNVLLLCNLHDKLFDRHLITFKDNGQIIKSKIILNLAAYNLMENFVYFKFNSRMLINIKKHRDKFNALELRRIEIQ